jgi:hypothetical protein
MAPGVALTSSLLATLAGRGRVAGLHTYLPITVLVDVRWVGALSLASAAIGLTLMWLARPRWRVAGFRARAVAMARAAAVLVALQVILYVAQAVLVAQIQGLPDAPPVVVTALLLQAALTVALVLSLGSIAVLLPPVLFLAPPTWMAATAGPRMHGTQLSPRSTILISAPRRGPPLLLHIA